MDTLIALMIGIACVAFDKAFDCFMDWNRRRRNEKEASTAAGVESHPRSGVPQPHSVDLGLAHVSEPPQPAAPPAALPPPPLAPASPGPSPAAPPGSASS